MAQKQISVHHHVVPRFLLDGFADPPERGGKLAELDKETGRTRMTSSKSATVIDHYYDLPEGLSPGDYDPTEGVDLEDLPQDLPERDLARIEDKAAPIVKVLRGDQEGTLTDEDRQIMALFLATMRGRTPRERENAAEFFAWALNDHARDAASYRPAIEAFLKRTGQDSSPRAVERTQKRFMKATEKDLVTVPLDRSLGTVLQIAVSSSPEIFFCRWGVLLTPPGSDFVTSDCPTAMFDPTLSPEQPRGNALMSSPSAQTTLALGRNACLMLRPPQSHVEDPPLEYKEVGVKLIDEINFRTYAWADRYVYGPSEELLAQLHQRAHDDPAALARVTPIGPGYRIDAQFDDGREPTSKFKRPTRQAPS